MQDETAAAKNRSSCFNSGGNSENTSISHYPGVFSLYVPTKMKSSRSGCVGEGLRFKLMLGKTESEEGRSRRHRYKHEEQL